MDYNDQLPSNRNFTEELQMTKEELTIVLDTSTPAKRTATLEFIDTSIEAMTYFLDDYDAVIELWKNAVYAKYLKKSFRWLRDEPVFNGEDYDIDIINYWVAYDYSQAVKTLRAAKCFLNAASSARSVEFTRETIDTINAALEKRRLVSLSGLAAKV